MIKNTHTYNGSHINIIPNDDSDYVTMVVRLPMTIGDQEVKEVRLSLDQLAVEILLRQFMAAHYLNWPNAPLTLQRGKFFYELNAEPA